MENYLVTASEEIKIILELGKHQDFTDEELTFSAFSGRYILLILLKLHNG